MDKRSCITHEFQEDLMDTNISIGLRPFKWLLVNGVKHRNVDRVA